MFVAGVGNGFSICPAWPLDAYDMKSRFEPGVRDSDCWCRQALDRENQKKTSGLAV